MVKINSQWKIFLQFSCMLLCNTKIIRYLGTNTIIFVISLLKIVRDCDLFYLYFEISRYCAIKNTFPLPLEPPLRCFYFLTDFYNITDYYKGNFTHSMCYQTITQRHSECHGQHKLTSLQQQQAFYFWNGRYKLRTLDNSGVSLSSKDF